MKGKSGISMPRLSRVITAETAGRSQIVDELRSVWAHAEPGTVSAPTKADEKGPGTFVPGLIVRLLVAVEVAEQPQDLQVQPHQRHGQAERDAPCGLLRRTGADRLVRLIEVDEEAERRDADHHEREQDRHRTTVAQRSGAVGE